MSMRVLVVVLLLFGGLIMTFVVLDTPYKACWPSAVGQECYDNK